MPDYQKCMMYKLICDEDQTFLYVGHTTNWNRRKASHKSDSSLNDTGKVYQQIRELGGWGNIKMIWIEDYPCNSKREGEAREQHWMDTLKSNMNTIRSFLTKEQKQEIRKEYDKERYENNKEAILEKQKERYENNKEAFAEYIKEYREANKEAIAEQQNVKYNCECGGKCAHGRKARHFRSKKHQDWLLMCGEVQVD